MYIPKNSLHFVMQSKGGAGKSVCAILLSQYSVERLDGKVHLVDTDPNNKTLGAFKALNVDKLEIIKNVGLEKEIDSSMFDQFISTFAESDEPMVVDTGSGEYLAITSYLISNDMLNQLSDLDKEVYIHCPINFGYSGAGTESCLYALAGAFPKAKVIVWENNFFGMPSEEIDYSDFDNIIGKVVIEKRNKDTYERDFTTLLSNNMTFAEAADSPDFNFMQKSRLQRIKNDIFTQLDTIWG
mgnify:FL=1